MRNPSTLVLSLFAVSLHAQSYEWSWAWGAGGAESDHAQVYTAPGGEVFLLGTYAGTISANGVPLVSSGSDDIFVQRLDPADGSVIWTAAAHHTDDLIIHSAAMRSSGELVVSGTITHDGQPAQFGPFQVAGQEFGLQAFVAGISPTGEWSWVSGVADPVSTEGWLVRVDANDNILLGCKWGAELGVYRFTGTGVQAWSATATSSGSSVDAYAMDVLPGGDLVLTGRFFATTTFGDHSLTVGNQYYDAFVARLSSTGDWQWAIQGGGGHWDKGFGVCARTNGDVLVAGTFRATATFGPHQVTAGGPNDVFVARVSSDGQWSWVEPFGTAAVMEVYGMAMSPAGDAFALTGTYASAPAVLGGIGLPSPAGNDMYVAVLDTTGQVIRAIGFGSSSADQALSVGYGMNGALFVAGYYGAAAQWGDVDLPAPQDYDLWVGRLDPGLSTSIPIRGDHPSIRAYAAGSDLVVENPHAERGRFTLLDGLGREVAHFRLEGIPVQRAHLPALPPALYHWSASAPDGASWSGKVAFH